MPNNPSAFPSGPYSYELPDQTVGFVGQPGMTLRDYFAATAMQTLLHRQDCVERPERCATWAYEYADAMLEAREK